MKQDIEIAGDNGDEALSNPSSNPYFGDFSLSRREVMKLGLAGVLANSFFHQLWADVKAADVKTSGPVSAFDFKAPPIGRGDRVVVPEGYQVQVLGAWGTPLQSSGPKFSLSNSGEDQAQQIGMHHDGMHFFPTDGSSEDGLLVVNHEYVEPRFMHNSFAGQTLDRDQVVLRAGARDKDEVLKEMNAHGVSIFRIQKNREGQWEIKDDARNRRLTGQTPMIISGPARGHKKMQTKYSPQGIRTRGTLNNCSHGVTPWNTYLAAEENWATYFYSPASTQSREHKRYGVRPDRTRYAWEKAQPASDELARFDASVKAESAHGDYRNEPQNFGWMVEVDPFDPQSVPVKRTALGRFAHEGVVFQPPKVGEPIVCYSGDDARFEYIYKYVSAEAYDPKTAGGHLLDQGTLYVAKFNEDQTGEWLPLVFGQNGLTQENGFSDQGDVLINTRTAADLVGATKMDRPEWGAVDPLTRDVYFTLTNNVERTTAQKNGPNPRANNRWGQIVRWKEAGGDPKSTKFTWEIFVLAGPQRDSRDLQGKSLNSDNLFCCPDGLWFDGSRRLWIQTDIGEADMNTGQFRRFGNNQMLVANPETGEIKRFLTGPIGQEITGVVMTPDQKTLFVNVQHPGATTSARSFARGRVNSRWPDQDSEIFPRSATLVITRKDGKAI